MTIIVINGGDKAATSFLANSLRNTAIGSGCGALLINDSKDGEAKHLLEKIIDGDVFVEGTPAEEVRWKNDPKIILVNSGADRLPELDAICPGFSEKFGPAQYMSIG